jgi:hypothetical protein
MADEVRLRATRDIPGIKARMAEGGYRTRRLKAGDDFFVSESMGRLLVDGIKKAEYNREPGRIAAPPANLRRRLNQLDHDGDGKPGGSARQAGDAVPALRAELQRLTGKRVFNGWNEAQLRERIAAAKK